MKVYVASSWRNHYQQKVVDYLRRSGFEVYDFKNPRPGDYGFQWEEVDSEWKNWKPWEFIEGLEHPEAERGFGYDMQALEECDACVLLLPCGRSAHLEAGFAAGAPDKKLCILMGFEEKIEPELMYKMADCITTDIDEVVRTLREEQGNHQNKGKLENKVSAMCDIVFETVSELSTATGKRESEIMDHIIAGLRTYSGVLEIFDSARGCAGNENEKVELNNEEKTL